MAIFGGGALIGPTLIMALHSGLTTSLVTVSGNPIFRFGISQIFDVLGEGYIGSNSRLCSSSGRIC